MLMRARRIVWMFGMVVGCGLLIAWAAKRQPIVLQPCPFDADLSLGVAFQGPHLHFDTYSVQDKLMNARIAWFSPTEHPDPDVFDDRVAQEPPEEDWDWWTTLYPTTLLVQVTDAQNRLGKSEVWKLEGNILKGIFPASSDGSTIIGSLELEAPTSFWRLSIKDKQGGTLAEALIRNPKTKLTAVVVYAKWVPHPPKRDILVELDKEEIHKHPVQQYDFEKQETIMQDYDCTIRRWRLKGGENCPPHNWTFFAQHDVEKVGILGPPPEGCSILDVRGETICGTWVDVLIEGPIPVSAEEPLCMTKHFVNDEGTPKKIEPPQMYKKRYVRQWIKKFPAADFFTDASRVEVVKLKDLQEPKPEDNLVITPPVEVPPYSKGCVHWDIVATTDIRAFYVAPLRKVKKRMDVFDYIVSVLPTVASGIMGSAHQRTNKVVEALVEAWTKDVSQRRQVKDAGVKVGDLKFYGDIWVLHLGLAYAKEMEESVQNTTQPVTVKVVLVNPDGSRTPVDASVECHPIKPLTTPPPPEPKPVFDVISAQGSQIHLGKGWKWLIKVTSPGEGSATIEVPPTSSVTIEARIQDGEMSDG